MNLFSTRMRVCSAPVLLGALCITFATMPAAAVSRIALMPAGFAANGDEAGSAVALSGDTAAVGAPRMQVVPVADSGAVEIFRRVAGSWQSEAILTPADSGLSHRFGYSVALSGDLLVVGALGCCTVSAIYTFSRSGSAWTQVDKFVLSPDVKPDLALSGDTLIVSGGLIHTRAGQGWAVQAQLTGDGGPFSGGVAIDGDRAVVGNADWSRGGWGPLHAYVFVRSSGTWTREGKFEIGTGNGITFPNFRFAINGDALLARAYSTVTAWTRAGEGWTSQGILDPEGQPPNFGASLDLQGDRAAVGEDGYQRDRL